VHDYAKTHFIASTC